MRTIIFSVLLVGELASASTFIGGSIHLAIDKLTPTCPVKLCEQDKAAQKIEVLCSDIRKYTQDTDDLLPVVLGQYRSGTCFCKCE